MSLKLAWRNIRHSFRDYAIYFITLLFGVAVFYAFNSIGSQQIMFDIQDGASNDIFTLTSTLMWTFSVVIACVLGFLVLYSNGFLIRRRKREFGTYLLLGMTNGQVSRIMLLETGIIGLISLILGLGCGILLSQGLSFATAAMFGTTINHYQFVFSPTALGMTILCFVVIYTVAAFFNAITVKYQKLANLLNASARNQNVAVRNPWVCLVVFIISLATIAFAYNELIISGLKNLSFEDVHFLTATLCMLIGTFLLFWSLAGFVIGVITKLRGVYFRGLIPFTVRQIASRVNTAFISLWAVCVMLFFSITVFSVGMGLVEAFVGNIEEANPYSASFIGYVIPSYNNDDPSESMKKIEESNEPFYRNGLSHDWDIAEVLEQNSPALWQETIAKSAQMNIYADATPKGNGIIYSELLDYLSPETYKRLVDQVSSSLPSSPIMIVALSQVNEMLQMIDKPTVQLGANECALMNNMEATQDAANEIIRATPTIEIAGTKLTFQKDIIDLQLSDNSMNVTGVVTVVPDNVINMLIAQGAIPSQCFLNVMYADNGKTIAENEAAINSIVAATQPLDPQLKKGIGSSDDFLSDNWPVTSVLTHQAMVSQAGGLRMLITYLAVYIGFILLIATAAILAVQQLSQAADSMPRYRMLNRIGCDSRMLNRSLLMQICIYFLAPLVVALCHSACAIGVIQENLLFPLGVSSEDHILLAGLLILVVYGGYLAVTYFTSRGTIKSAITAQSMD